MAYIGIPIFIFNIEIDFNFFPRIIKILIFLHSQKNTKVSILQTFLKLSLACVFRLHHSLARTLLAFWTARDVEIWFPSELASNWVQPLILGYILSRIVPLSRSIASSRCFTYRRSVVLSRVFCLRFAIRCVHSTCSTAFVSSEWRERCAAEVETVCD